MWCERIGQGLFDLSDGRADGRPADASRGRCARATTAAGAKALTPDPGRLSPLTSRLPKSPPVDALGKSA